MITIDRSSNTPVHEQIVEQLRYLIASGHYTVDETLPSTRKLGKQVEVSFHTVRKAYQQLEQEGLLEARAGSGYLVKERAPLSKGERIERGASVVQEALQKLIGLGLVESEVEYLFQEQFALLSDAREQHKVVFAAPYREMAELCSEQLTMALQQSIEATTLDRLHRHRDADIVLARFADLHAVMDQLPRADALGVITYLDPEVLERVARLLDHETLGLVTLHAETIQPLMRELRDATGFSGQIIAASINESAKHLDQFIDQTDLIVYTSPCRRRLLPLLDSEQRRHDLRLVVSSDSLDRIRQAIPR